MAVESFVESINGGEGARKSVMVEPNDGGKRMGFDLPVRIRVLINDDSHLCVCKDEIWGELYDRTTDPDI